MDYYPAMTNEILPFAETWMDLEGIMLRPNTAKERRKERKIYIIYLMAQIVKNLPAMQETHRLENSMDRRAWWATVHGVTKESDMTEVT